VCYNRKADFSKTLIVDRVAPQWYSRLTTGQAVGRPRNAGLKNMQFCVYIIKSGKDGENYIGSTADVEKRLRQHNLGENISTRSRRPFELIFKREFDNKSEVLRYESWLKKQKGGYKVKELINNFNMPR